MVLELHVWGPAFGLPSVDPACLAAVAYFNRIVPHGQWILVADYDSLSGRQEDFPLLVDCDARVSGFASIVSYLRNHHSGAYDLDYNLSHRDQTDITAFISFLDSIGGPLVDLYLYVSSENYNSTTSTAYTAILPWFSNYVIPPRRRDVARARTAHLGLSSLDITETSDDVHGSGRGTAASDYEAAKKAAGLPTRNEPKAMNMGRAKGLGGLLSSPIYAARFKLDALSNDLLQPLSDRLGKKDYLLEGDKPSSLDCLVFGYLALVLYAPVPQAWIKETIQTKFPRIHRYIRRLREDLLGNEDIKTTDAWDVTTGRRTAAESGMRLPWARRPSRAILPQLVRAAQDLTLPNALRRGALIQHGLMSPENVSSSLPSLFAINTLAVISSIVAIGLTTLAIHHRRSVRDGPIIFWVLRPQQATFDGLGVESFLGALPR